tara:strand:- start:379 stop:558 length:180 start_codon:yes stop_codon:yes gene_type:complete
MAKKVYKYMGKRRGMNGVEKSFDSSSLNDAKIKRLQDKGWEEVKAKPKPKAKAKPKAKD